MKNRFATQAKTFAKEVSLVGLVLSLIAYCCIRAIFHEVPFSLQEDGQLIAKITGSGFAMAAALATALYSFSYMLKMASLLFSKIRNIKTNRFVLPQETAGSLMPA